MFAVAVIKTGGKQYKVGPGSVIRIEKIEGAPGSTVKFNDVLMIGEGLRASYIGIPTVPGGEVTGEIIAQIRDNKVIVFKKKRRHNYRRTHGHRQSLTQVKILNIIKH